MHKLAIPQSVIDRVVARRGKEHVYEDLDPTKTALVVVDLQNAFMMPGVAHSRVQDGAEDRAERQPPGAGGAGDRRQSGVDPDRLSSRNRSKTGRCCTSMALPARTEKRIEALSRGSKGYELWAELEVKPEDLYRREDALQRLHPGLLEFGRGAPQRTVSTRCWSPAPSPACAANRRRATL